MSSIFGASIGVFCILAVWSVCDRASATEVLLKDGRILRGKMGTAGSLAEGNSASAADRGKSIIFLDTQLCRIFVPRRQVQQVGPDTDTTIEEKFTIRQAHLIERGVIRSVGPPAKPPGPFDDFGRRVYIMQTAGGTMQVIQAITEITPQWVKVEGLNYTWSQYMATSSISHEILQKILLHQIDPKNIEHRKKIARFYLQSERYEDARRVLEKIIEDFPDQTDIKQQLEPTIQSLRQQGARRLLSELKLRRQAGQHQLVHTMLGTMREKYPTENMAGEILQEIRETIQEYEQAETSRASVIKQTAALVDQISDARNRQVAEALHKEIQAELTVEELPRMAAFAQNFGDPQMKAEDKLALALSGWLRGADQATAELTTALSAYRVRGMVRKYLTETVKLNRGKIFRALASEEAASVASVAHLLAQMKPPFDLPEPVDPAKPGYYRLEVVGLPKEPPVVYYLQLPPEYDPYRRYPMVVSLHGAGSDAEHQVDWWAGGWTDRGRFGQATRQGYIVLAPQWGTEHQKQYDYSAREHAAVLSCLRDACRRFAVDTDRVYLSGHSMGGDAAWDVGLAHPDLWAGVIPIVGESQKFCMFYWKNAKHVPFYVVGGELDGTRMARNARDLDRYMQNGYNVTVVEYLGRGHEHFSDELLRLFDWMGRCKRDFFPKEFSVAAMRPWDNYFWWSEFEGQPAVTMVEPTNWPPPRGTQPIQVEGYIRAQNAVTLRTGAKNVTVFLAPEMVEFKNRISVSIDGRRINTPQQFIRPSLDVLLEDVRTRGDRQHPFWAKVESPSGKVNGGE